MGLLVLHTYIYWIHTDAMITDTVIKDAGKKDEWRKTQEDFFNNIFTSHFIARVRKGCWRFACERVLETEHKLHILTPLLWPSRCVFLVLLMFNRGSRAHSIGGFREPPRSGVAFPTTSGLYCLVFCWQLLWDPNSTELNNNNAHTIAYWIFEIECLIVIKRK